MSLSPKDILLSGSFSGAGKLSLNKYNIITHENRLKRKEQKGTKFNRKFFIIPNYELPAYDDENTIIHSTNFKLKKFLEEDDSHSLISEKENDNILKKVFQGDNYKYYNLHQDRVKFDKKYGKKIIKKDNLYTPGYYKTDTNYFHKIKLGLKWKNITGRKEEKIIEDKKSFYTNISKNINKNTKEENNRNINKCFIDMSKQTERNGFPKSNDLRERCEKKYVPLNSKTEKENWIKFCKKPLIAVSPFSNDTYEIFGYRRISLSDIKKINKKMLKKFLPKNNNNNNANKKKGSKFPYLVKYNSTLDFKKSSKKEYIIKNYGKNQTTPICILYPNYKSIEEKIKMMVVYNNNNKKKLVKNYRNNNFKGINLNDLYDASKSYKQIYGHRISSVPNFEKMMSRPKDDILPSFMKGIYNGMSSCLSNEKSLFLNNYTDRKEYENKNKNKIKTIKIINQYIETKKENKNKDPSKEMLQKFNNLYSNFYKSINNNESKNKNKYNKELCQKEKSYKILINKN